MSSPVAVRHSDSAAPGELSSELHERDSNAAAWGWPDMFVEYRVLLG